MNDEDLFEERTIEKKTIWTYGPYTQYKVSGGRQFKVRMHFEDDRLTTAYIMWEMMYERDSDFFAKDEDSVVGG